MFGGGNGFVGNMAGNAVSGALGGGALGRAAGKKTENSNHRLIIVN